MHTPAFVQVAPAVAQQYHTADLAAHAAAALADGMTAAESSCVGQEGAHVTHARPPQLGAPTAVMMRLAALELTGTRPPAGTLLIVHNLSGPTRCTTRDRPSSCS